ncbi:hypothetical protein EMIT0P2_10211 [Pseudomonas sp. IT-P2]
MWGRQSNDNARQERANNATYGYDDAPDAKGMFYSNFFYGFSWINTEKRLNDAESRDRKDVNYQQSLYRIRSGNRHVAQDAGQRNGDTTRS